MERIERLAELSILRGVGFAGLGIATVMLGLSFDVGICFQSGAVLAMIVAVILAFRAWEAPTRSIKQTEIYVMVEGDFGLPADRVQKLVGALLRRLYGRYARLVAGIAIGFWGLSLIARLA